MRHLIRACVELSVGQPLLRKRDGNIVGSALDLLFEQLVDAFVVAIS